MFKGPTADIIKPAENNYAGENLGYIPSVTPMSSAYLFALANDASVPPQY